jgi:hypothetical protein
MKGARSARLLPAPTTRQGLPRTAAPPGGSAARLCGLVLAGPRGLPPLAVVIIGGAAVGQIAGSDSPAQSEKYPCELEPRS